MTFKIYNPYTIVGFHMPRSPLVPNSIWFTNIDGNNLRLDKSEFKVVNVWFKNEAKDTLEDMCERNSQFEPIYAESVLVIGGEEYLGVELLSLKLEEPEHPLDEMLAMKIEEPVKQTKDSIRFQRGRDKQAVDDHHFKGFTIDDTEIPHLMKVTVWKDERLADRIIELLNEHGA